MGIFTTCPLAVPTPLPTTGIENVVEVTLVAVQAPLAAVFTAWPEITMTAPVDNPCAAAVVTTMGFALVDDEIAIGEALLIAVF
jgi:hypothetical protein